MRRFSQGAISVCITTLMSTPAGAAFVSSGTVSFADGGVYVETGTLGITGTETLNFLDAAVGSLSTSSVTIDGSGTVLNLNGGGDTNRFDIQWGSGSVTISGGAKVDTSANRAACSVDWCNSYVGNAAGADATLTITGAGSLLNSINLLAIGQAAVHTLAADGLDFGTPNATSTALMEVLDQGTLNSELAVIGWAPTGPTFGNESATATVNVAGTGSSWNLNGDLLGGSSLWVGAGPNGTGALNITDSGALNIDSSVDGQIAVMQVGRGEGAQGSATVSNSGSVNIHEQGAFTPDNGAFINVGRELGTNGTLSIDGGSVALLSDNSEAGVRVGRDGGTGNLHIAGLGTLSLEGDAFVTTQIGRGAGASGTANIDNATLSLVSHNAETTVQVGREGGTGTLSLANGADLTTQGGNGSYVQAGRDGGTGVVSLATGSSLSIAESGNQDDNISALIDIGRNGNGTMTVHDSSVSIMSENNWSIFRVGRMDAGTSGSALFDNSTLDVASVNRDALVQIGRESGAAGTMTLTGGSSATLTSTNASSVVQVGREGTGTSGTLNLTGIGTSLALSGVESYLQLGRDAGASGTMNIGDGADVTLNGETSRVQIGRAQDAVGTLRIDGGATLEVIGTTDSSVTVGGAFVNASINQEVAGTGLLSIAGSNSSLTVGGNVLVGTQLSLGGISGAGIVNVKNGAVLNASNIRVGAGGLLQGDGQFNANVVGDGGTVSPGNSPGTMTINGDFILPSGVLNLETENGISDQLAVSGNVLFGTNAIINLLFDELPSPSTVNIDDYFSLTKPIFDDDFLGSAISVITGNASQAGLTVEVFYGLNSVNVTAQVVPLPAALPLFGSVLGMMGLFGWQRRRTI
ncbi:MAG: hypothetical protein H6964_11670 [Chromatiaceae bacterium]|nr:hypothetical protein [Chromatiaceae bacterium]MCP5447636.1 hypothetical protein [Chromatiaceae bacterium]